MLTWLVALVLGCPGAVACAGQVPRSTSRERCAWTTSTPADRRPAKRSRSIASSTTARGPGSRTQLVDATNLGKYLVRSARAGERPRALLARVRVDLRRMGDDERSQDRASHLPRVAAVSVAATPGRGHAAEAPGRQHVRADLVDRCRSRVAVRQSRAARDARRNRLERCSRTDRRRRKSICS